VELYFSPETWTLQDVVNRIASFLRQAPGVIDAPGSTSIPEESVEVRLLLSPAPGRELDQGNIPAGDEAIPALAPIGPIMPMTNDRLELSAGVPTFAHEGPAYRTALRLGFAHPVPTRLAIRMGLIALATWVSLLVLSFASATAFGHGVEVPFLRDPTVYSRYLVALPLLILAEVVVGTALAVQSGYFIESGLIPEKDLPKYQTFKSQFVRLHDSWFLQGVILILSYVLVFTMRNTLEHRPGSSSWERLGANSGGVITPAGWWCILVSLPLLVFLFSRWFWRACVWDWFLFRVSRLALELTPTHPDHAGGLGYLAWGQASFSVVLAAISAVLSGSFAAQVLYAGASVNGLKYHVAVFVGLALAFVLAPLLVFSSKLAQCRFQALLDFGMLAWRHDHAFDDKWIRNPGVHQENLLGCPDASSLADLATGFEHVQEMQVVPIDRQAVLVLVAAAVGPMLPFFVSTIPLTDILGDLMEFMV
jgi:hypothetical protein